MKRKIFFAAIAVFLILFSGCSSKYEGVPRETLPYWDYILNQYANSEEIRFKECSSYVLERSNNSAYDISTIGFIMCSRTVPVGLDLINNLYLKGCENSEGVPFVYGVKTTSILREETVDNPQDSLCFVMIQYCAPDENGQYEDAFEMFVVPKISNLAYPIQENAGKKILEYSKGEKQVIRGIISKFEIEQYRKQYRQLNTEKQKDTLGYPDGWNHKFPKEIH